MLNKYWAQAKASLIMLRVYLYIILGVCVLSVVLNVILGATVGTGSNTTVSAGNVVGVFLLCASTVLPAAIFRKITNLGSTRGEYYRGLLIFYAVLAAGLAVLNVAWLQLEVHVLRDYYSMYDILEVFHWDRFGYGGSFLYQFGAYMMLASLLNFLFSGLRHYVGWISWGILIAAIPVSMSIDSLREHVADGVHVLLMNDSVWQGFALNAAIGIVLIAGGWGLTYKRAN